MTSKSAPAAIFRPSDLAPETGEAADPKQTSYADILGFRRTDPEYVIKKINKGLPYTAYKRVMKATGLVQRDLGEIIQIPTSTLARRREQGRLSPDESDRLVRISRILALAIELFEGDDKAARTWLSAPAKNLAGETPLKYSQTEVGAREVEQLIGRLEHGVYS